VRRLRDVGVLLEESGFDDHVARRLPPAPVVHGATGQCLATLRAARRRGSRTVLDVVNMHVDQAWPAITAECARFGVRPLMHPRLKDRIRLEYEAADLIRVMSERARTTMLEHGVPEARVFTAPPHFDLAEFPEARFSHDRFRVSFVGLLEPWKGFHYLVEAFRNLALRDAELVLWGGSSSRPVARYLAEQTSSDSRIRVQAAETRSYGYERVYGISNVLVHPSLTEGFGFVVAEAMACGIPVVVTDATGAADLVEDGRNGYVVPAADAGAIRERLQHLADHPSLAREMGAAARAAVGALTLERFRAAYVPRLLALL
jgi:glycosyltransferase involved in cell wall biosynthesis